MPGGARLKHSLRARGAEVLLTVFPGDDRHHPERFALDAAEARRWAWSILADLDPQEAAIAAVEAGLDLEIACSAPVHAPPRPGSSQAKVMHALAIRPKSRPELEEELIKVEHVAALLAHLVAHEWVERYPGGPKSGHGILWQLSRRGRVAEEWLHAQEATR